MNWSENIVSKTLVKVVPNGVRTFFSAYTRKISKRLRYYLIKWLPVTKIKILLASVLYNISVFLFSRKQRIIKRNGINYKVDLSEGFDLSLFILGNFQKHNYNPSTLQLSDDSIVLDVGANFGIMSLQFAKLVPNGKVYAFEPTHFAFSKLTTNLSLNPELANHVIATQSFVSSHTEIKPDIQAYSSWKVDNSSKKGKHPVHWGSIMPTEGVSSITLDDFCSKNNIDRIDFIKIDTDGHEPDVLQGAKKIISRYRPKVMFEIGLYAMDEKGIDFLWYYNFFNPMQYILYNSKSLEKIHLENYLIHIPLKGIIDILAIPVEQLNKNKP